MNISTIIHDRRVTVSCELFPPKPGSIMDLDAILRDISALSPAFVSVTYGASGSTSKNTLSIVQKLQDTYHVPALAHLTCVSSNKQEIERMVADLQAAGIHNILALRGDLPQDGVLSPDFHYASELISYIRYRVLAHDIRVPIVAGIMPVTNVKQIQRSCQLSGTNLPPRFQAIAQRFGDDPAAMKQAGIAYATEQIIDLIANGVEHIHIYTMNKPNIAAKIMSNLSNILRPADGN